MQARDINIVVITALPHEYAAVNAALSSHPEADAGLSFQAASVRNIYGHTHNVAILLLPSMGNNSSAAFTGRLSQHFPISQSVLMVGIAGAVPNPKEPEHHVRLGDIVVSGDAGVVQYDFEKESADECESRHPPRPPASQLLQSVRHLEALLLQDQELFHDRLKTLIDRLGKREWGRPSEKFDVLHNGTSEVRHPLDRRRKRGRPRIFIGTIGSANRLQKNPARRDLLGQRFKVRAIEMEASGVAEATWQLGVGYLVIRGTCDYCDQYKNDTWQKYAAAAAATYCATLITHIPEHPPSHGRATPNHDDIETLSIIGRGAAGTVFKVRDNLTGGIFALKELHPHLYDDETSVRRLKRELRLLAELGGKNYVISAQPRTSPSGKIRILMPYIEGPTLAERIRQGNITEEETLRFSEQLLTALDYIHSRGIVHRDIKPENILIDASGDIMVADFGIAGFNGGAPDELTRTGGIPVGGGRYGAPELADGSDASTASDVYSAALVMRAMQTGAPESTTGHLHEGMHGILAALVRAISEARRDSRPTAANALALLRASRRRAQVQSQANVTLSEPHPTSDAGLQPPHTPASYDLGRSLRECVESCRPIPISKLNDFMNPPKARELIEQIRARHISSSWHSNIGRISVADIIKCCSKTFWIPRIKKHLEWVGVDHEDRTLLDSLDASALPFRTWMQCLGHPKSIPYPEEEFRKHILQTLRQEFGNDKIPPDSQLRLAYSAWRSHVRPPSYTRHAIPKERGGIRWIHSPIPVLKKIQREVGSQILRRVPGHPGSTAFSQRRSSVLHARRHAGARAAVVVDIRDFFGSIRWSQAARTLFYSSQFWAARQGALVAPFVDWSAEGLQFVREVIFMGGADPLFSSSLPQGAPTSPVVANAAAVVLDHAIESAPSFRPTWKYSRYADDLVISTQFESARFYDDAIGTLSWAVQSLGWELSPAKTRHWSATGGAPLILCGLSVPDEENGPISLPRDLRRRLRAACHILLQGDADIDARRRAHGLVAYAYSVTSNLKLLAYFPNRTLSALTELGRLLPGASEASTDAFLQGWRSA